MPELELPKCWFSVLHFDVLPQNQLFDNNNNDDVDDDHSYVLILNPKSNDWKIVLIWPMAIHHTRLKTTLSAISKPFFNRVYGPFSPALIVEIRFVLELIRIKLRSCMCVFARLSKIDYFFSMIENWNWSKIPNTIYYVYNSDE